MPSSFSYPLCRPVNCNRFDFTIFHSNLYSLRFVGLLSLFPNARCFITSFFVLFIHSCQMRLVCSCTPVCCRHASLCHSVLRLCCSLPNFTAYNSVKHTLGTFSPNPSIFFATSYLYFFLFSDPILSVSGLLYLMCNIWYPHVRIAQVMRHLCDTPFAMVHAAQRLPAQKVAIPPLILLALSKHSECNICALPATTFNYVFRKCNPFYFGLHAYYRKPSCSMLYST